MMSALCINPRVLGYGFGYPASVIECWMDGKQTPNDEDAEKFWKLFHLPCVQFSQPGFLHVEVVPPPDSKR
jgi:hypothetical protein